MTASRRCAAAIAFAVAMLCSVAAHAPAGVVYLAGGAGCPLFLTGLVQIAAELQARGFETHVGCNFPIAEILTHRGRYVALVGHSYGAKHAGEAADQLAARGMHVKVVGLEPLFTQARTRVAGAVNIYGQGGVMAGAKNEVVSAGAGLIAHIDYAQNPNVQRRVIAAVIAH